MTFYVRSPNFDVLSVMINFLSTKNHRENILKRTICDIELFSVFYIVYTSIYVVLVFSKCFRDEFRAFSTFKSKVIEGTNYCYLWFKIKTKTYLVFISMVVIHSACHC